MQHIRREGQQPIDPTPRELICRLPVLLLAGQGRSLFTGLPHGDLNSIAENTVIKSLETD